MSKANGNFVQHYNSQVLEKQFALPADEQEDKDEYEDGEDCSQLSWEFNNNLLDYSGKESLIELLRLPCTLFNFNF